MPRLFIGDKKQQAQLRTRGFSRRVALLGGAQVLLLGSLAARLYDLQVVEGEKYRLKAEANRISLRLLPPPRGRIFDRHGVRVAGNRSSFRALLVAEKAADVARSLADFARLVSFPEEERARVLRDLARHPAFTPILLKDDLPWAEMSRVEINLPDLPGISIEAAETRDYPFGADAAHVIGYVHAPAEADVADDPDPLLRLPGFHIGKLGLEKTHERALRGEAGLLEAEVNSAGRVIRELDRREGSAGADLEVSLDSGLQQFAQQRLAAHESAAAVVLDVARGDVLAMASTPGYDPALFQRGLDAAAWRGLQDDPHRPLTNKCIADEYAPGSTFKLMTALAALEGGIAPDSQVHCTGALRLGALTLHCWKSGGHGALDMLRGLQHSCDVFFYEMARRVGIDAIAAMARRFGLGVPTGIELDGERPGLIPDVQWKRSALGQPWYPGETPINGIGQGYVLATPLQLCQMTARIAGGHAVAPHLEARPSPTAAPFPALAVDPAHLALVRHGMDRVVNDPAGTAYRARIETAGQEMAGKTGTAQVRRIGLAERAGGVLKNENLPWQKRDHALFVAFAPVAAPRFAIAVVIEHGGGGSRYAAPVARDILSECQRRATARDCSLPGRENEGIAPCRA